MNEIQPAEKFLTEPGAPTLLNSQTQIAASRAGQEVQAAIFMAKQMPRDQMEARRRILDACRRPALAEASQYAYPRGNETVSGPSIRMAEMLAQNWGNLDFGIIEVEQRKGESVMQSYCWDLETNVRQTKVFTVKHERHTKKGSYQLKDPRDIYELSANMGARRLRACILGVIPGDIVEEALEACDKTIAGTGEKSITERTKAMTDQFEKFGVTIEMIEKRLGHKLSKILEIELVEMRKIYLSIKDGFQGADAYFGDPKISDAEEKAKQTLDKYEQKSEALKVDEDDIPNPFEKKKK